MSDSDTVPVPIDSEAIKYHDCVQYGTIILSESDHISVTLFQKDAIGNHISSFNAKIHSLKNNLAQVNQQINGYKQLGENEKVHQLAVKADFLEKQIKSAQSGLKTLISMNS